MTQVQEQKQFFADFGKKINDTVESIELASIQTDKGTYDALGLNLPAGRIELWGLIVFCTQKIYFYVSPAENYMTTMMRQATHEKAPEEQFISVSSLEEFKTTIPPRKWYSFLFNESKYRIDASFRHDGITRYFSFSTHKPAFEIQQMVQAYQK
ncbi:MAG: hypothetical protein M0P01_03450 [Treponema sp.]|nr:hypothetical protein [Treponema sp.]